MRVRTIRQAKIRAPYPTTRDQREVATRARRAWDVPRANPAFSPAVPLLPDGSASRVPDFAICSSNGRQYLPTHLNKFV